jgi:electron transport complex protein RnfC
VRRGLPGEPAAAGGAGDEDPIQAAIERAKAKKAAQLAGAGDTQGERDKLEKAVLTTRTRLETATAKLQQARAEGSDLVDALQLGVDKTRAKLEAAEQALRDLAGTDSPPPVASATADPAAAAIARALAARETGAGLSAADKARGQLEGLEQRLEKTRERLAASRANGEQEKIIEALESTVVRLEEKVHDAREHLKASGDA